MKCLEVSFRIHLGGGFNPSEKYAKVKLDHLPHIGVKTTDNRNHHLVIGFFLLVMFFLLENVNSKVDSQGAYSRSSEEIKKNLFETGT